MSHRHLFSRLALIAGIALSGAASAHDYKAGDLQVGHPWARPTVPGQPSGGAYLSIENKGKTGDKLVSVSSPVAKSSEIHTMSMDGNVMKMREVGSIDIKPSEKIAMQPGNGYHIMLIGLSQPLKVGDKIPLTLTFEKAGKLEVSIYVEDKSAGKDAKDAKGGMEHMHH
jgi:copper(I)-binding protein